LLATITFVSLLILNSALIIVKEVVDSTKLYFFFTIFNFTHK